MNESHSALLVGAFERDNFGDLLFLHVTEEYLGEAGFETAAAGPFASRSKPPLNREIGSLSSDLVEKQFQQLWTVGGEVGAVTIDEAAQMAELTGRAQDGTADSEPDLPATRLTLPYLIRPTRYPLNGGVPYVVNSVGLAGLNGVSTLHRDAARLALQQADHINVREQASSDILTKWGIDHSMAPDVVQTIALRHPAQRQRNPDVILLQASAKWLRSFGVEQIAAAIVDATPRHMRVGLFVAGAAKGHDSTDAYGRLIAATKELRPGFEIEIADIDRDPWALTDAIANCALWIGSSLHGRVISSAYGVPRVGLPLVKLNRYAQQWDNEMPFGVNPKALQSAVSYALSAGATHADRETGAKLGLAADRAMKEAVSASMGGPSAQRAQQRNILLETTVSALRRSSSERMVARLGDFNAQARSFARKSLGVNRGVLRESRPWT